jgi:hypothetical protein
MFGHLHDLVCRHRSNQAHRRYHFLSVLFAFLLPFSVVQLTLTSGLVWSFDHDYRCFGDDHFNLPTIQIYDRNLICNQFV